MSVQMEAELPAGLTCTLRHGPSGAELRTDAPTDNGGQGSAFSPTDLVGAALLSCALTTMAIVGAREGIVVGPARGRVVKEMVSDPRRIGRLTVHLELDGALPPAHRARLEAVARGCPVARSLGEGVQVVMTFSPA